MEATKQTKALLGGEWLIKESNPFETFIPEDFNEEQKMVMDMCAQFLNSDILPNIERIDKMEPGLMPSLIEKAGELGLLSTSFPEKYGGLGKDFITASIVNEGWVRIRFRYAQPQQPKKRSHPPILHSQWKQ